MQSLKYFFGRLTLRSPVPITPVSNACKKATGRRDMSVGITRRSVIILADEQQYDDYCDLKAELEEKSNGVIELEDLEDIKSSVGGDDAEKLKRFLEDRHAIILINSENLNKLLNQKRDFRLDFDGNIVNLSGTVLHSSLEKPSIHNKVIVVSIDGFNELPNVLQDVKSIVKGDCINKSLVNNVIFQVRGIKT